MAVSAKVQREIHDHYFKHCFGHRSVAIDFLKANLTYKLFKLLDLSTMERQETEFLKNLHHGRRRADLLYEAKSKHKKAILFRFHLEHQSIHDKFMAVRVMEYHAAIARHLIGEDRLPIPTILAFVIYHGKQEWTSARSVADLFEDFGMYCNYGLHNAFLVDLRKISPRELLTHGAAATPEITLSAKIRGDALDAVDVMAPIFNKSKICCRDETIDYIKANAQHREEELFEKIAIFDPDTAQRYTTMFELAKQREREQGIQQGMRLREQEIAKSLQALDLPSHKIEEITVAKLRD